MKNSNFDIQFNSESGAISSICIPYDKYKMNWCADNAEWGIIRCLNYDNIWGNYLERAKEMLLIAFDEGESNAKTVYSNGKLQVTVIRSFTDCGSFCERYILKNITDTDILIRPGEFGIIVPFNDRYTNAKDCMTRRCNTHIWCGGSSSHINALKMGVSNINLGLVLTKGNLHSYSQLTNTLENASSRGDFVLNTVAELCANEEYIIEWEIFVHKGKEDFIKQAQNTPAFVYINAEQYTVYKGEKINFTAMMPSGTKMIEVFCGDEKLKHIYNDTDRKLEVSYSPQKTGEYRIRITYDNMITYADFMVVKGLESIVENRVNFIVDKQQYINPDSALHGAYLIYDNKQNYTIFENGIPDHNASRERVGMALLIIKYLRTHTDLKIRRSLDLYIDFLKREFYEEETGEVFDTVRKNRDLIRLYNAPWVMMLFAEMYFLTKDANYINDIEKIADNYYSNGGLKFYPNAFMPGLILKVFRDAGSDEGKVKKYFINHAENILEKGLSYPPHEVNYEQTIVAPAVTILSEIAAATGDDRFKNAAKVHVQVLESFNGMQPDFHLNEIPIRYWDGYWFGKCRLYGDTMPHYWSCLTAHSYADYYLISGNEKYRQAAKKCIRNCLCLFDDSGKGSAAYMYPFKSDDTFCKFYDDWANDQDFALYYALIISEMNL